MGSSLKLEVASDVKGMRDVSSSTCRTRPTDVGTSATVIIDEIARIILQSRFKKFKRHAFVCVLYNLGEIRSSNPRVYAVN